MWSKAKEYLEINMNHPRPVMQSSRLGSLKISIRPDLSIIPVAISHGTSVPLLSLYHTKWAKHRDVWQCNHFISVKTPEGNTVSENTEPAVVGPHVNSNRKRISNKTAALNKHRAKAYSKANVVNLRSTTTCFKKQKHHLLQQKHCNKVHFDESSVHERKRMMLSQQAMRRCHTGTVTPKNASGRRREKQLLSNIPFSTCCGLLCFLLDIFHQVQLCKNCTNYQPLDPVKTNCLD